jgi:nucleoside 2-deoxyribosyltransferase
MKTVYLVGPIDNLSPQEATAWRQRAKLLLNAAGFKVVDPTQGKDLEAYYRDPGLYLPGDIVPTDLRDIERADILLVDASRDCACWGSGAEVYHGFICNKQIIAWGVAKESASMFLRYFANRMFPELDRALEYIVSGGAAGTPHHVFEKGVYKNDR